MSMTVIDDKWSLRIDSTTCVAALSCSLDGAWLLASSKNGIPDTRVCSCVWFIGRATRTKHPFSFVVRFLCLRPNGVTHAQQTIVQFIYDLLIADCVVVFKFSLQFESSTLCVKFTHTNGEWWWQTVRLFRQLGMNMTRMHLVRTWGQCQQMHQWLNDKDDDGDDKQGNEAKMPPAIDLCSSSARCRNLFAFAWTESIALNRNLHKDTAAARAMLPAHCSVPQQRRLIY